MTPRLGISPQSSAFFSSPYRDASSPYRDASSPESESLSVSPKTERFSPSINIAPMPRDRLLGPFGRTRFAVTRGGRRVIWLILAVVGLVMLWRHDGGRLKLSTTPSSPVAQTTLKRPDGSTPYSPFYGGTSRRPIDISSDPLPIDATLTQRLDAWEKAPGAGGKGDIEPPDFVGWNMEQCGANINHQLNRHMVEHFSIGWASLNKTAIGDLRRELIGYMRSVENSFEMSVAHRLTGRGIVMLAGDGTSLNRVLWSVNMIRSYGCNLPVNVYHFENERPADDDPMRLQLEAQNVSLVTVMGIRKAEAGKKSYHLKAHGIILAPFRHVLYLDSDSIPVRNPEYMWDAPNYKRLGVWMTPDYWKTAPSNPLWAVAGVKCRNEWENEAGQILVDKGRHMDALLLSRYMLENHDEWFKYSDGDKDILLRWTLIMLRKRWGVPGRYVAAGALPRDTPTGFCGHSMMQYDSWGEVFTCHWNLLKNIPSGTHLGYTWGRSKQLPMFNTWPASPATARLGEPLERPTDGDRRGLGDIDSDMLADADESGFARAPATEMVMRRASREQGVQAFFHGGGTSAFCIGLRYLDPRPQAARDADEGRRKTLNEAHASIHDKWASEAQASRLAGLEEPPTPEIPSAAVQPDWSDPFEVANWNDDKHLKTFEDTLYLNFKFDPHWKP